MKLNPRYVAYAQAHGRTPDVMLEHDRDAWPGGCMCGFILWISRKWAEWDALNQWPSRSPHGDEQHAAFDAWIGVPQ